MTALTQTTLEPLILESFVEGKFTTGSGAGTALVDPVSGEIVAHASSTGIDLGAALRYMRTIGGPALRSLSYAERGVLLARVADVLSARKEDWYAIALRNSGNTRADAAMDVDGAIFTLKYFARLAERLGPATSLIDGPAQQLTRSPVFQGLHLGVSLEGAAIHINAFNFPSWGLWEKAAVALLAGVPVFAKPASSTAMLTATMVRAVIEANALPEGTLSLLCGSAGDLLDHVMPGDAIAFTGSALTGRQVRSHPRVLESGVRVNIEADSLNAALLGPDAESGSESFELFIREVVREMTAKAGQKCTAIRRILVPEAIAGSVASAIGTALAKVAGQEDPSQSGNMGPVVSSAQRDAINDGLALLSPCTEVVYRQTTIPGTGSFVGPMLLRATLDAERVHDVEIFGPVATIVSYRDADDAFALVRRGSGSLVVSVFSADETFLAKAARCLASSHGRVLLVDPTIGEVQTGHGTVLPSLIHGGPGRAGGGEELGGVRGLNFYHQWTAIAGPQSVVEALTRSAVDVRLI